MFYGFKPGQFCCKYYPQGDKVRLCHFIHTAERFQRFRPSLPFKEPAFASIDSDLYRASAFLRSALLFLIVFLLFNNTRQVILRDVTRFATLERSLCFKAFNFRRVKSNPQRKPSNRIGDILLNWKDHRLFETPLYNLRNCKAHLQTVTSKKP